MGFRIKKKNLNLNLDSIPFKVCELEQVPSGDVVSIKEHKYIKLLVVSYH